ncbi:GTA-2-like protein [Spironucleus salmonicida]|uniref:GTA-2-like protein n=1 Tax=Spironucleus salmonicida TaxID=348837 RepID=V6LDZ1_9EUKA|nr:GTA-2-like protein [Spironucleus salmonicida]|eukprot:EST42715.1 GTA-2-like protein [Spironucleus salmonicida]
MCEAIYIPQKLYYRRGSMHTVAGEVNFQKAAILSNNRDLDISQQVAAEFHQGRCYPMLVNDSVSDEALQIINNAIKNCDTLVVVGDYKLQNFVAQAVADLPEQKQIVVVPVDAKPIHLMTGYYKAADGAIRHSLNIIPEYVILDSGLTDRISKDDVALVQKVVSQESETVMIAFTKEAQRISKELIAGYGTIDMPVWKERATNVVGITMLGQPCGKHVIAVLGL